MTDDNPPPNPVLVTGARDIGNHAMAISKMEDPAGQDLTSDSQNILN